MGIVKSTLFFKTKFQMSYNRCFKNPQLYISVWCIFFKDVAGSVELHATRIYLEIKYDNFNFEMKMFSCHPLIHVSVLVVYDMWCLEEGNSFCYCIFNYL